VPGKVDLPLGGHEDLVDQADKSRLPRSVGTEQPEKAAARDFDIQMVEGGLLTVFLGQFLRPQDRVRHILNIFRCYVLPGISRVIFSFSYPLPSLSLSSPPFPACSAFVRDILAHACPALACFPQEREKFLQIYAVFVCTFAPSAQADKGSTNEKTNHLTP